MTGAAVFPYCSFVFWREVKHRPVRVSKYVSPLAEKFDPLKTGLAVEGWEVFKCPFRLSLLGGERLKRSMSIETIRLPLARLPNACRL